MRKGKPDAAVERLVRKARRKHRVTSVNPGKHASKLRFDNVLSIDELRAIITEARKSAARECAEIADPVRRGYVQPMPSEIADTIRERFGLEGK